MCEDFLSQFDGIDFHEKFKHLEGVFAKELQQPKASMQQKQELISQKVADKIEKESDAKRNAESKLRVLMLKYKRPDDEIMQQFPDWTSQTHRLSAEITYTIMGAAIAYQYGILKEGLNNNSFRFICVDEAFAKQDEDKAIYLMDLVQKLNLQMLLVTPDDKIQIAEPYISAVHIVHRVNNRTSRIFDTTIQQAKAAFAENLADK